MVYSKLKTSFNIFNPPTSSYKSPGTIKTLLFVFFLLLSIVATAQTTCGYVLDKKTGERLAGVNFRHTLNESGTVSDERGYYCITAHEQKTWVVSRVGYRNDTLYFDAQGPANRNIYLEPAIYELQTVDVVQSFAEHNFSRGLTRMNASALAEIPSIGGERDLVKAMTTLPGIGLGAEGFSSLTVRGGGTEHNLFILDGTPIYNSGHLFNIVSVFNPEAVKDVAIYKNAFPARYGGRLASVIEVNFRDGNSKETEIKADLGIINSKFTMEGPLGKSGKTSYMFAARSTYLDLFKYKELKRIKELPMGTMFHPGERNSNSEFGYTFSDVNLKFNHRFNPRNWMFVSLYSGIDLYRLEDYNVISRNSANFLRSNYLASIKSFHQVGNNMMVEFIASINHHANHHKDSEENYWYTTHWEPGTQYFTTEFHPLSVSRNKSDNSISDLSAGAHLSYTLLNQGLIKGGLSMTWHGYSPPDYYRFFADSSEVVKEWDLINEKLNARDAAAYISYEKLFWDRLDLYAGVRASAFSIENTFYLRPDPRLSLGYRAQGIGVFNLSYSVMHQYNHALMKNEQMMNNTVWVPSTQLIGPEQSHQYSLGYMRMLFASAYQFETHVYHKQLKDMVFFKQSVEKQTPFYNWQDHLLGGGRGRGQGVEVSLSKLKGRLTGNVNYAFSKHERQFDEINQGNWFPYKYNREHVFNVMGTMMLSEEWKFGFFWTYSSGARINLPNGEVNSNPFGHGYYSYTGLNNTKLPAYHRLDLSFDWSKELKKKQVIGVSFNIYNAYYRKNSTYAYIGSRPVFDNDGNEIDRKAVIKSVSLIPILPSINVSYKFK